VADDVEEVENDELSHDNLRNALTNVLDALAGLSRADKVKIITCVCRFFELPRSE